MTAVEHPPKEPSQSGPRQPRRSWTRAHVEPAHHDPLADDASEPLIGIDAGKLRKVRAGDLGVRFAFGAAVSVVAGLVGMVAGPKAGGLFLAFPAILPATLTLIEKKEDNRHATNDTAGAVLGAVGLGVFGVVAAVALSRMPAAPALLLAAAAWLVVSVTCYLLVEPVLRRRARSSQTPTDRPS